MSTSFSPRLLATASALALSTLSFSVLAKPLVYVSVMPQKYMIEQIAGDAVDVKVLVQPGHNPHSYDPTGKQMAQLSKASLLFTTGVPFEETWLPRISKLNPDLVLVDSVKGIKRNEMEAHSHGDDRDGHEDHSEHDHGDDKHDDHEEHDHDDHKDHDHDEHKGHDHKDHDHDEHKDHDHDDDHHEEHASHDHEEHDGHDDHEGELDPHVWMNPKLAIQQADNMTHALEKAFPESAEQFEQGFAQLKSKFKTLDHNIHEALEDYEGRTFMVFHPAWGYYAQQYHLEQVAIEFEGKSPSARKLVELTKKAEEEQIKVILVQSQFNRKPAERIASHIDAKVVNVDPVPYDLPAELEKLTQQLLESWR